MKKIRMIFGILLINSILLTSCYNVEEKEEISDRIPAVMYNGSLYLLTGDMYDESRRGEELGEITSVVSGAELPEVDFQANNYQIGDIMYFYGDDQSCIVVIGDNYQEILEKSK